MNNATLKITALTALILAGTGMALAQGPGSGGERPTFEELDMDGSGEITAEDFAMRRDSRFAEVDTDGDGSVTEAEFLAAAAERAGERAARMFARLDADGDGVLSRDALEARGGRGGGGERMLSRLDEDGSGGVSAEEFEAGMEKFAERRAKRGKRGGGDGWGRGRN